MRPIRALILVAFIVGLWAGFRVEAVRRELADLRAERARPAALAALPPLANDGFGWEQPRPLPPPVDEFAQAEATEFREVPTTRPSRPSPYYAASEDVAPSRVRRARAVAIEKAAPATLDAALAPPPPVAATGMGAEAYATADRGYRLLATGDRRGAADAFRVALSMDPEHPSAANWRREAKALMRRWRFEGYAIFRDGGDARLAARPVLGGGATGFSLSWTPAPLARRPISLYARSYTPNLGFSQPDAESAVAAVGVSYKPLARANVIVSVERLIALGPFAQEGFAARVGAGGERRVTRLRGVFLTGYGEGGVAGDRFDLFAGAQGTVEKRVALPLGFSASAGVGAWGAVQAGSGTIGRLDLGPTISVAGGRLPFRLSADYKKRVAGGAAPGDGVSLSIYSQF